jgi:hypothetical protein
MDLMNVPCTVISKSVSYAAFLICVFAALCVQSAQGQSSDTANSDVVQLKKQLAEMQAQMEQLRDQVRTLQEARKPSVRNATFAIPAATEPMPSEAATADAGVTTANVAAAPTPAAAPQTASTPTQAEQSLDVYGFAMVDAGYSFKSNDPTWFDVVRPGKLPSFPGQFGQNGNTYWSVRQSRFGVKGVQPTPWGDLKAVFEFDMFGVGKDAGVTTIRPRHYYGELGQFLAGQTNSAFMDIDVFPNTVEYWGPNGMVFLRNPQLRWMPIQGDTHLWIALEAPGQSGDQGLLSDRDPVQNVKARFRFPDLTGQYRYSGRLGYLQGSAIWRNVKLDDTLADAFNLNQSINGWGFSLSSLVKAKKDSLHLQYTVGNGIENYMNDAPFDVAPIPNPGNPTRPIKGKPLPMWSMVAYLDHSWSDKLTTSLGFSDLQIQNTTLQAANAYHEGQYSSINLLYAAFKNVMYGGEFQWGRRTNARDGFNSEDYRLQFSFKYTFNARVLGGK